MKISLALSMGQPLLLTENFTRAIEYARHVHVNCRKNTNVPFMAHLIGVAALVMGENGYVHFPVTEDMVIAALLHDAAEDEGGLPRLKDIEANFGKEVASIVEGCSDSLAEDPSKKQQWETRKKNYIKRLSKESDATLLVSAADKLYNVRSILDDRRLLGKEVWKRFNRGRKHQIWYYSELLKVYRKKGPTRLVEELDRVLKQLERLSKSD